VPRSPVENASLGDQAALLALQQRVVAGERDAFEALMRAHNQRLFRIARGIVKDDHDAEDVVQEAYLSAFRNLQQFEGRSEFTAWLCRIAVNMALTHVRRRGQHQRWEADVLDGRLEEEPAPAGESPEAMAASREFRRILERAVDALPAKHRAIFMMRDVEGMTGAEVSQALDISEVDVRVALHRARTRLKAWVGAASDRGASEAFGFAGERCDRIVKNVLSRLTLSLPDR